MTATWSIWMGFPETLARLRKDKGWTQQQMAEAIGMATIQVRRYERGVSQPTLDVIKRMALVFGTSTDMIIFGEEQPGPDAGFKYYFEALKQMDDEDRRTAKALLDGLLLRHQAKVLSQTG